MSKYIFYKCSKLFFNLEINATIYTFYTILQGFAKTKEREVLPNCNLMFCVLSSCRKILSNVTDISLLFYQSFNYSWEL